MAFIHTGVTLLLALAAASAFILPEEFRKGKSNDLDFPQLQRNKRESGVVPGGDPIIALVNSMFDNADSYPNDGQLDPEELWDTLEIFDGDGDGRITSREYLGFISLGLMPGLQNMPNKGRTAVILFGEEDKDGDRELSRDDADITFQTSDTNGDQFISKTEYFSRWQQAIERLQRETQAKGLFP